MQVSRNLFIHIGLPKTGTTYLQRVLAAERPVLRREGLLYPGDRHDHFFPAQDVLDRPFRGHSDERAPGSWDALVREVTAWSGSSLISHETFTVATPEQIRTITGAFPEHEIAIIVTARDTARQLTANWQESIKNGESHALGEYVHRARSQTPETDPQVGFWFWQDLVRVLGQWQQVVPGARTHLVTVPPSGVGADRLWGRFAEALGVSFEPDDVAQFTANTSLGRVETEFVRRLNADLDGALSWPDYRTVVKQFLAQRALPRFEQSGQIVLAPDDQLWAAQRSREIVQRLSSLTLEVHGDLADLESPETSAEPPDITDDEVVEVGARAIAQLLRRIGREHGARVIGRAS